MKNPKFGRKTRNGNIHAYLQEAALDRKWEEMYRKKFIQVPEDSSHVSPHRLKPEGRTPMSEEADTV